LVDECQDLTECQVDWFLTQASLYKKQVFFVGDTNQGIYGFRGAKSTNIINFDPKHSAAADVIDRTLTHSFRFDQNMACAANTILFMKERSLHPDPGYRVTGAGKHTGTIVKVKLNLGEVPNYTVLGAR
jgi:DNA helicase-2/ATP-dependent DNA helicase PcrA